MKRATPIRHGEILLVPVNKVPKGKTEQHTTFIVGHSETGHHHVLEATKPFEVTETERNELYLRLFAPTRLVHQKATDKHRTLTVPAGIYQRFMDTEYDVWEGIIRRVQD